MSKLLLKGKKEQDSRVTAKTEKVEVTPMLGKRLLMRETAVDFNNPTPPQIAHLQRTIGNQAVQRLVIQRKMTLGPVGDKYEQEADAVAKQVMNTINTPKPLTVQRQEEDDELQMMPLQTTAGSTAFALQRQEEDDELQMKPFQSNLPPFSFLQRQEEEDELQMKPILQRQEEEEELQMKPSSTMEGGEISSDIEGQIQNAKGGGRPLAANTQSSMGQAFNADFSGVKVHTNGQADTLNRSLQARAFTTGQDIFFRSGEYSPNSSGGQKLLAHELTHTIQQGSAAIKRQVKPEKTKISTMRLPQIQRAWDVVAIEKSHPKSFAQLLAKMHILPMIRRSMLTDLAAVTDSPGQLEELVKRIPPIELKKHLAAFPHSGIIKKIVYLCKGSDKFNSIMQNISTLGMTDEIVELFNQETAVTLTEIDSVIDGKQESEGLKASNGTLIGMRAVSSFSDDAQTAIQDALDAYDDGSEHAWAGKWGGYHGNGEGNLPGIRGRGGYKEYDVRKYPKDKSRWGSRRLVIHNGTGRIYYTWTHYGENGKPAFVRIR